MNLTYKSFSHGYAMKLSEYKFNHCKTENETELSIGKKGISHFLSSFSPSLSLFSSSLSLFLVLFLIQEIL